MNSGYWVQGLKNNTLVAGKTTAFRIAMTPPGQATAVAGVRASILRPDGSIIWSNWNQGQIVSMNPNMADEAIVVLIAGSLVPDVGAYYANAILSDAKGEAIGACVLDAVMLSATKDLRMMINRIWSNTGPAPKPGEVKAAQDAMTRLATLYPVRDGISTLNGDMTAGLRYDLQNDPEGPPHQDANIGPSWDPYKHPPAGQDTLDSALQYRLPDVDEPSPGGGAITHANYNGWLPNSGIVWLAPIGQPFCHETGHNHGLEPPTSPHFDPTRQKSHSKDEHIDPADAAGGFDIQFNAPFPQTVFDVMFPTGPNPGNPHNQLSMNSWDWEYLRTQIVKSNSTGPHGPALSWSNLGGHNLSTGPAAILNQDGRMEVFVLGGDRALYHIWENMPGGDWHAWDTLQGNGLTGPVVSAANADGSLLVFVRGGDGQIYARAQTQPNGDWNPWFGIGGNQVRGFSVAANFDHRLEMVAVFGDGALHHASQTAPGGPWSGWVPLGGDQLKGPVSLAANADGRLEAFVVGGDGHIYHIWQANPDGVNGWSGWGNLIQPGEAAVSDLHAQLAPNERLFVVLMNTDGSVSYLTKVSASAGWDGLVNLAGHGLRWPCGVACSVDGRLQIAATGGDGTLYGNWQVDPARPSVWAGWAPLGGNSLGPGIALRLSHTGRTEHFVIGGDGELYMGFRAAN
jgi:hypothetical protein